VTPAFITVHFAGILSLPLVLGCPQEQNWSLWSWRWIWGYIHGCHWTTV